MDRQKLIEYLKFVVDLEKQRYLQKKTIAELDCQISSLGIQNRYSKPNGRLDETWAGLILGVIFGVMVGAVVSIVTCESFGDWKIVEYALIGAVSLSVIGFICGYASDRIQYRKKLSNYNASVQIDDARVAAEMVVRKRLEHEIGILKAQYKKTKETLKHFYDAGLIYKRYRFDFVAVSSFLDYLESGMCQTLEERVSRDGAYNTYEELCRLDKIIYNLDEVVNRLEEIKANQWTLYNAIQDGNRISARLIEMTNRIAAATEQTARNSEIAAYSAQQSANELNLIKWLQFFSTQKK